MADLTTSQKTAVRCAGRPLFIQAGAGTGKTFTLTKRLAYGLSEESGPALPGVDSVLTITFTNKAAAELLGRVRAELRAQGLAQAALGIDAAWISTIHSMCSSLLSSHALEAGIDPGMELLSEEESDALLQQAVDQLLPTQPMQELVQCFGPKDACALVTQLAHLVALAPAGAAEFSLGPQVSGNPLACARGLLEQLEASLESLEALGVREAPSKGCATATERLELHIQAARELCAASACEWQELVEALGSTPLPKGGNLKKAFREDFAVACDSLSSVLALADAALTRQRLERALELGEQASHVHCRLKEARGVQDTNDLLIKTYRLLEEHPAIAREYRERFDSVMVDEFQDTDSLQVGIIGHFCDEGLTTLTTVGDKQQSIYRFRGADPAVYDSVKARMLAAGGQDVALDTNFRSHPGILSFVEALFSNREFWGSEFLFIKAGSANARSYPWIGEGAPRVELQLCAGSKNPDGRGSSSIASLREAEAELIAARFEELARAGAPYGSMALLMFSTKSAAPYLAAMRRRGIPCAVSGGSDFFIQPEVVLMSSLLRVLELPDDDKALLEVLASPLFDLPDGDLLSLRLIARRELRNPAPDDIRPRVSLWDALCVQAQRLPERSDDPLLRAHGLLQRALGQLGMLPLHQLLQELLEDSGWLEELREGGAQGQAVAANLLRFCDLLARFEGSHGSSAVAAAEHFASMCQAASEGSGAKGKPGRMVCKGQDAVQVMTIHASKGLEFPIVAVAQFERSQKRQDASQAVPLTEHDKRYLLLPLKTQGKGEERVREFCAAEGQELESFDDARTAVGFSGYGMTKAALEEQQEQERLLYVALTRARDLLILSACDKSCGSTGVLAQGSLFERVMGSLFDELPAADGAYRLGNGCLVGWRCRVVPYREPLPGEDEEDALEEPLPLPVRSHALVEPRAHVPLRRSVAASPRAIGSYSALASLYKGELAEHGDAQAPGGSQEDATSLGSAFHLVAQWLALQPCPRAVSGSQLSARIDAAARRYALDDGLRQRLEQAVAAWMASDRFASLAGWQRLLPEHPFCVQGPNGPLEGFFDLLCCTPGSGSALVIDYKTGVSGGGEELRQRYALQAAVYAFALLSGGLEQVELAFVRPEAGMQELCYSYSAQQLPQLAAQIAAAAEPSDEGAGRGL
ncbi:MAG: UvrD-helicase domain-containing protein [Coriobacteriales bacterium]